MRYVGYVWGEETYLLGKPEENKHLEDLCLDGRIILKSILKK